MCENCGGHGCWDCDPDDIEVIYEEQADHIKKNFINLTPHAITIDVNPRYCATLPPSGVVARVSAEYGASSGFSCLYSQRFGQITGLPEPEDGKFFVVSALVLAALAGTRPDVVAPATGHPAVTRDEKGQIKSVPGFVR
jgi:hypothetical protein